GTLDLNGFDLTVSSLSGVGGTVDLGTATLTVDQDADTLYAGQITGTGGLHKSGAGTLALTGASTYTGTTEISGGVLRVDGSLASAVTVHAGALLAGKGTVGGLVVNGGTVSPGNSIGTLKVAGEVDFSGGGIFEVEVDAAGNSDRIEATGKALLDGGKVLVLGAPGDYTGPSTEYVILSAAGGVQGEFDEVTSSLTFLTPELSYGADDVVLTLLRNDVSFFSVAGTRNQRALA